MAGDVQLTVDLEPGDVTRAAEDLRGKIENIFDATAGKQVSASFMSLQNSMNKAYQSSAELQARLEELENTRIPTTEYATLEEELKKLQGEYEKLSADKKKWEDMGFDPNSSLRIQAMGQELEQLDIKIGEVTDKQREMQEAGTAFKLGINTAEYDTLSGKLADVNNQMRVYIQRAVESGQLPVPVTAWIRVGQAIAKVGSAIGSVLHKIGSLVSSGLQTFLSAASTAAQKLASSLARVASNAIRGGMSKLSNSIFGIRGSSESANVSIKKGIKLFIKYAFGVRSFFFLYKKIRKAIVEGFQYMAQYSGEMNGKISSMLTSLDYLKHSLTTAFAPIVSYVAPILTRFMDLMAKATTSVGQFFASLLGQTSFIKAKKVYHDYAKDLQKSEAQQAEKQEAQRQKQEQKEAERLKKQEQKQKEKDKKDQERLKKKLKQYERQLAGFDDVEILKGPDEDDTKSNDTTDTTSSSTSPYTTPGNQKMPWEDPKNMFETVQIEKRFKDLANKIKGFFKSKDWEGLGKFMADGINSAFEKIDKTITSAKFQQKIKDAVDGITRTFNSLVDNINWELIGKTFGDGINLIVDTINRFNTGIDWLNLGTKIAVGLNSLVKTVNWTAVGNLFANNFNAVIHFLYGVITTFDWAALGKSLGKAINGFFLKVDWNKLALTLSGFINGVFSGLYNLATTIKWSEIGAKLGNSLSTLVRTVDWAGIAKSLSTFVSGALDMIISAVQNFDWQALGDGIGEFLVNIDWLNILIKLIQAIYVIGTGLVQFGLGLFGKIFTTIFEKIAEEVKGKSAKEVVQGLLDGLKAAIKNIISWLAKNVVKPIGDALSKSFGTIFKAIAKELKDKSAKEIIQGLFKGIIEALAGIGAWMVKNVFNPIITAVKNAFGIASPSKKMAEQGRYIVQGMLNGIKDALANIGSWIKTNVFDKVSNALNSAFDIIGGVAKKVASVGKSLISGIKSGISDNWSKLSEKLSSIRDKMFKILKNGDWKDIGSNIVDGIEKGIQSGWRWLKDTVGDLAESLYDKAKRVLGIESPSKVFRDQVGKMIPAGMAIGIDNNASAAINSVEDLANQLTNAASTSIKVPPIVGGQVIPYAVGKSTTSDTNTTLKQLLDMLQYSKGKDITINELESLLANVIRRYMNIEFYIGDEQVARHANAGNAKLERRYKPAII